jgi:hypothetical protein
MKISHILALCVFHANVCGTTAFSVRPTKAATVVLRSSTPDKEVASTSDKEVEDLSTFLTKGFIGSSVQLFNDASPDLELVTPNFPMLERIEGGKRVQTYQMPAWAERCQMIFATKGRPLKADIQLMLGPLRTTHQLKLDIEDGMKTPYQATLKFKKDTQVLKVTTRERDYPVWFGLFVPSPEKSKELNANTEKVWDTSTEFQKQRVQGAPADGGASARRYWTVPPNVKSVQVLLWSRDVGKKSLKVTLDVMQGAENVKQEIFVQCGGGSQPYHAVIQTPVGGTIGVRNHKFVEDGLMEVAFVPYETY